MANLPIPPTYAEPLVDDGKKAYFNPIWLKWFLDFAQLLQAAASGSGVNHEALTGLLGGAANDHYHTTGAEKTTTLSGPGTAAGTFTCPATGGSVQNTSGFRTVVIPAGGAATAYAVSRDNVTFFAVGVPGFIVLGTSDWLKVTHAGAPTLNYLAF